MAGRTCLYITHDLEAASRCDRIVVIEAGRIVECGTHTELIQLAYADFERLVRPRVLTFAELVS